MSGLCPDHGHSSVFSDLVYRCTNGVLTLFMLMEIGMHRLNADSEVDNEVSNCADTCL